MHGSRRPRVRDGMSRAGLKAPLRPGLRSARHEAGKEAGM
jgi:hypothetical protein